MTVSTSLEMNHLCITIAHDHLCVRPRKCVKTCLTHKSSANMHGHCDGVLYRWICVSGLQKIEKQGAQSTQFAAVQMIYQRISMQGQHASVDSLTSRGSADDMYVFKLAHILLFKRRYYYNYALRFACALFGQVCFVCDTSVFDDFRTSAGTNKHENLIQIQHHTQASGMSETSVQRAPKCPIWCGSKLWALGCRSGKICWTHSIRQEQSWKSCAHFVHTWKHSSTWLIRGRVGGMGWSSLMLIFNHKSTRRIGQVSSVFLHICLAEWCWSAAWDPVRT